MSTLKDIITGRQDSKKYRKDNFGNSGEHSGMITVYTGRGETGYENRNFDVQRNSERSIRDIITGKETPSSQNNKTKGVNSFLNSGNQMVNSVQNDFRYNENREYENKYKNYNYEQLKTSYKSAKDDREKNWILNKIKKDSSSEELQNWYDTLSQEYDSKLQQNSDPKISKEFEEIASEYEELIKDKQHQETAQKNQKKNELYSDYYKEYDYNQLKEESENSRLSDYERSWLENAAYEKASSDDLQTSYDNNEKTMKEIREQKKNVLDKQNKASSNEEKQSYIREASNLDEQYDSLYSKNETLKNQIEKKKYDEKKKAEYDDLIENDVKAKTIMQKYYNLQKYDEDVLKQPSFHTIQGFENNKGKSELEAYSYAKNLSEEERKQIIKDFNSLENKDTLYKYYKREREEQETAEQNQILTNYSEEHPVLGSLASMGLNTYGSIEDTVKYAGAGIDKAFGGDGYINPDSTNVAKAQVMREKVSEDMDGLGKFFYNTTMSIGDNIARMPLLALPGGKAMSLALAGTSAGVSSANDVINSGGTLESALWTGAAAGTAEVVFEKISLDKLIDLRKQGTDSVFRAVVNQMKTEGLEEVGTDIANAITDRIINGDMSQLALQYQNYIAQGYSEEEARKQIAVDFALQLGQSFAAGAISGGVLSGGTVAINKIGGTIEEKSEKRKSVSQLGREALQSEDFNVNELIKSAKKSENPKAVNLANSLEKVVEEKGADKVKAVDVGNLLTLTNSKEITYDYSQDLSELTGTDKQNIIDSNFKLNGEEKTAKTSNNSEVKYTDTKAFGENYPHGLGAKIVKTGERINIVGLKSSSRDFNSDDNTVVLLSDNGELYDSDDIRTSVPYYNDLFDYAKNFDTIGARVYLSQYEDYVKRSKSRGKTADVAEYSESFERLYSYGVKGVTYDSIKKSGNFTREINILGAGVAYSAVQSGNNDFKVDTRDKSNKRQKIRMPGESNSISSKVYVDPGSEDSVKVTDEQLAVLQAVAEKTGREIVLTDRMGERTGDENANGGYNPNDGKIYINAEVHDSYMLSVSLHEAVHGVAADNPAEYHALCTFITNYLVTKGENIDNLLDDIKVKWGDSVRSEDAVLEELVCQTVMAIATDEAAIKTALSLEENKGILKKVASALKKIAKAAYDFIKGVGIQAHNKQAQPWIDNIEALNELAVRLEKAFESTRKLNEQRASAAENAETEQKNNTHEGVKLSIRLSDSDLNDYLKAGNRKNKIKLDQIAEGKSIILTNENDIIDYIDDSISGNKKEEIKAYGKANKQLVSEILRETNESVDVSNYYLELPADNLFHAYREHSRAKIINNIPLSKEEFEKIPEYFDRYDKLLYVRKYASGVTSVCVSKNISNGKILIIETVSKSRGALQFKNAFGLNEEGYIEFLKSHGLKNKISSPSSGGSDNSNTMSLPNGTAYNPTLSQNKSSVNNNSMQSNKNNTKNSVDDVIDENRDLVAVHNLSAKKLAKMISDFDGQGIPAPSIAIDKADNVHSDFGEISLIFDRNTIDPKADRRNSVYSRDAWTSMYPKTEFKLNEKAMKKLAERLDMSVNELKSNMFDTSDVQKIKYRFEDDFKVRKAFLKENNIKATPVLRDKQPDIMMFSARAVKKFVRKNDCTFDRLVNDKEFRNELFKAYSDGASLKGIANAHIKETDEILDLAKSEEFYSVLKEKFDYAIEYAKGNVQQTEGSMTEAVNNAIEEYKEEFSSYIDELLSSGVLGEEYIVRDDVDPYDDYGDRKPFSKTHYKYNIENVVKAMKSGRSKVGSSFTGGISYVKSIGAKKLSSIDEIKGNKNRIVPMTEEEIEAENERISDLIKPLIEEVADSGSYNNDFITASNNIVDAFNSKNNVNGVYSYLKQYHDKIKMSTVKKLFAAKAEIENLPTRYFEAKPHRAVGFDEVKAAVIPADTHEALKGALKELGVPMYEYDSNNENSRAEATQKAINTEYVDKNGEKRSDLRFSKDDTIVDYSDLTTLDDEEIKVYNKRGWANQLFTNEERKLLEGEFAKLKPVKTQRTDNVLGDGSRIVEVNNKIVLIGGTFAEPEIYCVFAINAANETEADIYKEWFYRDSNEFKQSKEEFANNCKCYESSLGETFVRAYIAVDFSYYKGHKDYGERAVLPSSFKNYGYTEQFQDGTGNNRKAGRNVSEIKLAVDDTIIDYLAEEYGKPKSRADFLKILEENPNAAILMMYRNSIETAQKGLYLSESIKLPEETYRKIARKVLIDMGVKVNNYGSAVGRLAESIKHIVEKTEEVAKARVVSGPGYFRNLFENFAKACSDYVKLSSRYNENYRKNVRDYVNGLISNNVLVVRDDDIELIKKNYGSVTEFRSRMNGKTKVGMAKNGRTGYYIEDVADWVYKKYPKLVKATRDKDGVWHWIDKDGGFRWFDMLVNDYLEPKLDTRVESSTVKSYYEDRQSAGFEAALNAINCVLREKVKVGVNEKRIERRLVKELDNEAEQSTNELKELKWAKYRIEELRKRNRKLNAELNKGMSAIREEYYEARMKTVERNKLIRKLNKFIKLFENGKSSKNYVPDVLQKPMLDVLKMIEMNAGTYKNGKQKATPKSFDRYTQKLSDIDRAVTELTEKYETLKEKQVSYSSDVEFSIFDINTLGFEEETLEMLKTLQEQVKGKNIYELSAADLRTIYDTINELDGALKRAVEVIIDGQKTTVQEAALKAVDEIYRLKVKKGGNGIKGTLQMLSNQAAISSLDPERFSRYISGYHDDYVIRKIINELHNGEKKVQRIKQAGYIKVTSVLSKYSNRDVKYLQKGDVVEFDFTDIDTNKRVKVSPSMLMGIYLTVKQEDGLRHIINDDPNRYLSLPDLDLLNKNNPISDLRQDNRRAVESERHRVRLTEDDISHINNYIETNSMLKELCNAIMVVFNEQIATEINNVSLQTQGRKIAVVKNYYPLSVDPDCPKCKTDWEFTSVFKDQRIKNKGFTKNRTYSILPLRIDDAMSVFSKHISETAEYCGLLVPLTNFMKIYRNGSDTDTVKSIIKKTYGEPAIHYINKFIGDLQKSDNTDNNLFLKWQGKYMGAKLLANPGAMIQQFSAFPLANKYFGTKNVAAAATVGFNKIDFDLYAKYTTYLWYRAQGNGTIHGEVSKEVGFHKKLTDYLDIMGKVDRLVVGRLLYAAELHVEQTTDLKRGTDAFYKEVVRQFEKCVDETQPNNMVTSKPQFIRNNVMRALSFSAFRSQVMAVGNCIIDSFGEYNARRAEYNEIKTEEAKAAKKEAAKNFLKVLIGAAISFVLGGILKCIADIILRHKYDDIKDEKGNITLANIAWKFADESLENLASSFIWGDKLYEIGATMIDHNRYFGLEVMSVGTVNDGVEKAKKGDWFAIAALLIDGFGYPAENMLRYGRSIIAYINDISNGYGEVITKNNSTENNTSYFNFIIVEAKQKGETEKAEHFEQLWKDDLISKGKTEEQANDTIKTKLVTALAVSDDDVEQAALAKANGDLSSYEEHMNKVVGYGFDSVDVKKAVDKVIKNVADDVKNRGLEEKSDIIADLKNQGFNDKGAEYVYKSIQNGESSESEDELSVFSDTSEGEGVAYTYSDAFEYLKNGDRENYERIEQYLIDNADKTKKDVQSAMRSASRTDELWKEYFEAQGTLSGGGDPVKLEELKKILTNIYGSWSTAVTYGRKYKKRMQEKEREKNK